MEWARNEAVSESFEFSNVLVTDHLVVYAVSPQTQPTMTRKCSGGKGVWTREVPSARVRASVENFSIYNPALPTAYKLFITCVCSHDSKRVDT